MANETQHELLVLIQQAIAALDPGAGGLATEDKQDDQISTLGDVKAAVETLSARGVPTRVTDTWTAWDGVAARKLTVRSGAGYVRIVSYQIPGGGGAGGATERTAYFTEVGDGVAGAKVVSTTEAIADMINDAMVVPRLILADSNGQIDFHVVPDAGTTAKSLDLDVESV